MFSTGYHITQLQMVEVTRMKPFEQPRIAVARPLYSQVRDMLLQRISGGEWGAGDALPNEFLLSGDFGVSIGTIRRAIEGLEQTGVVKRIQGRGTYVAGPGPMALDEKFCRLRLDDSPAEVTYELETVTLRRAAVVEAAALKIDETDDVVAVRQRVLVASALVGIETSVVSKRRFPRLDAQFSYGQLVYRVLADYGALVTRARESVSVEVANVAAAGALACEPGEPLLEVRRLAFTVDKEPVEVRFSSYRLAAVAGLTYDHAIL